MSWLEDVLSYQQDADLTFFLFNNSFLKIGWNIFEYRACRNNVFTNGRSIRGWSHKKRFKAWIENMVEIIICYRGVGLFINCTESLYVTGHIQNRLADSIPKYQNMVIQTLSQALVETNESWPLYWLTNYLVFSPIQDFNRKLNSTRYNPSSSFTHNTAKGRF